MRITQGSVLESLRSVQAFIDAHADALGPVPTCGTRKRLDDIVTSLDGYAGTQVGSQLASKGATQKHYTLRRTLLHDHMAPIAKIAASEFPDIPEFDPLRMPKGRPTAERLKAAAYGMAETATPFAATFTGAGLADDFIAQLTAAADAVVATVNNRRQSRSDWAAATKGLEFLASNGRKIVHILDAMIKRALKGDPALLRAWNSAKRVQLIPGGGATAPAPAPAPAPAAAPEAPAPAPTPTPAAS